MKLLLVMIGLVASVTFNLAMATPQFSDSTASKKQVISRINLIGNKTTKNWIIFRELSFAEGDSLSKFELLTEIEISKQNLTNTSLFNFVDIRYTSLYDKQFEVFINVTERWYLWPVPVFQLAETNFNSWYENKDFSRINYGVKLDANNFRGRNEKLDLTLQFGFTEKLALSYSIPYINKSKTLGLTVFGSAGQNHEVNYLSYNNKRVFYKDVDELQLQDEEVGFAFRYRKKFFSNHTLGISYNAAKISDSILFYNPNFLLKNNKELQYLALSYRYILDKRNNKNYALTGHYFSAWFVKYGLNAFSPGVDLLWNKMEYKQYWKVGRRTYLAGMAQAQNYFNDFQPYYFRDGLGYTDKSTIRSYELYVIDAQQMGVAKLQFRYQLIAPKSYEMAFVPVNKFKKFHYSVYLGVFGDSGFAHDQQKYPMNKLADDIQFGYGVSLDLVTYYDLVFRAEYSMNKFGEHGLFLHFVSPI